MPVTELAWVPSAAPGSIPPAFIEAGRKGMEAQSEWAAQHASATLPTGGPPSARGAALYQQREDRGVALVTAHWDSAAQHAACIASEENKRAMEVIVPLSVAEEIKYFHVEGVRMFSGETLDAGLLSVVRIAIEGEGGGEGKRDQVEKVWDQARRELSVFAGFEHTAGWRIEKELGREDRGEFVVVGGWRDEDVLSRFVEGSGEGWKDMWKGVMLDMDVKSYIRIV